MKDLMQKLSTLWCLKGVSYSLNVNGSFVSLEITYNTEVVFSDNTNNLNFKNHAVAAINQLFDKMY
ncbi:hypothetical protein EcSzw1_2 [Escherichia phage EcSzw_1]|nr:hypothetical protein EcSzw2_2 [Escherichia phage EcSzw-2]QAY00940.1 hypothetical protein EcSzw1_2 [Escherichia phage EcSzw_1]